MALGKFVMTLMTLFSKKKRDGNQTGLEEMKLEDEIRKEKRGREKQIKRENWHQSSEIEKKDQDHGKKIIKMIRTEEDSAKMGNVYEKARRMLKNERR